MVSNKAYTGKPCEPCAEETALGLALAGTIKDSPLRPRNKEFVGITSLSIDTGFVSYSCQFQDVYSSQMEYLLPTSSHKSVRTDGLLKGEFNSELTNKVKLGHK
jgi:hypothetical protein